MYLVLHSVGRSELEILGQLFACCERQVPVGEEGVEEAQIPAAPREGRECPGAGDGAAVEHEILVEQQRRRAHVHGLQHRIDEHLQPDRRQRLDIGGNSVVLLLLRIAQHFAAPSNRERCGQVPTSAIALQTYE